VASDEGGRNEQAKREVGWVVAVLVGASLGLIVDDLWVAIRDVTANGLAGIPGGAEDVVTGTARDLLVDGGALLGLAAIVYLLAPERLEDSDG